MVLIILWTNIHDSIISPLECSVTAATQTVTYNSSGSLTTVNDKQPLVIATAITQQTTEDYFD
jgi:hypothetical protein